ncbi:hypothetical protein ACX93W_24580 [Paenibacillus sp. CAU 1782]
MEIGDVITFGSFEWIILDIKDDRILILAKDIIELRDYHNKSENITWKDCTLILDYPSKNQRYWFQRKDINNIKRRASYLNSIWWWWTRTPGKNNRNEVA